jgi:hypothetical protein
MPNPANLVHQTSTTTGTGNFTLSTVNGKNSFSNAFSTGVTTNVFDYYISNRDAAEWERGTGHMSDATTLVRDTVKESTNSNNAVNFSAGTKDVTNDVPAANVITVDSNDKAVAIVRLATTANITISTDLQNGDSLDGSTLSTGDLVLVKNQSASEENGIYTVVASGAASRTPGFDTWNNYPGRIVVVRDGTVNADSMWLCTVSTGGTLGSSNLRFINIGKASDMTASGGFGPMRMTWGSNANTSYPSFRMDESTSQPTFITGNLRLATPGDGVDFYTVTADGTPASPTQRTGAYAALAMYNWPVDNTGSTTASQTDEAGIHTFGRPSQIRLFQMESPTQTARGGALSFGVTKVGTRTPIDRLWCNGASGNPGFWTFAGRAFEDSGISYPYSATGLDTTDIFSPMTGINPIDYTAPGVVTILAPDRATAASLAIMNNTDTNEGHYFSHEKSTGELWIRRSDNGTVTNLGRFGKTGSYVDLGFSANTGAAAFRAQGVSSQIDRIEAQGGDGTTHPKLTIDGTTANPDFRVAMKGTGKFVVESTDSSGSQGPAIVVDRQSSSPAAFDDLGVFSFYGRNSAGESIEYGRLRGGILDPTDASEDGRFEFMTYAAGSNSSRMNVAAGIYHNSATGGDKGANTINFGAIYDDNTLLTCFVIEYANTGKLDLEYWDSISPTGYHEPAHRFWEQRDLLDIDAYAKYWKEHGHLPGLPSREEWKDHGKDKKSLGDMIGRLWQTVEMQAVQIDQLNQKIKDLESKITK